MRILLIVPTFHYATEYPAFLSLSDFPTGMAYLASSLKQAGHEVFGCNPNNIVGYVDAPTMLKTVLPKRIAEVKPELIGLGGLCTDYKFLKDAIGIIRGIDPKIPIVLGGQIVTNDAEDVFNFLKPDYAIVGEGEEAICQLVALLVARTAKPIPTLFDPSQIAGLWWWSPNEKRIVPPKYSQHLNAIDSLPFPDYEPFGIQDMMDNYSMATRLLYRYSRLNPRVYGIVTARGCPFSCTFCVDHHRGYRERLISNIMEEIRVTYDKYHFNILLILDELFAVNKERMVAFCQAVIEGKQQYGWDFDWMFQTHASARLDLETLKLAKQAGCVSFSYGLESASPTVLKSMNKKINPEQVIEAIRLAGEAEIGFSANLIFGDIAETMETMAESFAFWFEHCKDVFVFLGNLMPYPGSAVFEACRQKGMFPDKQAFYENIDKAPHNITSIADREYHGHLQLIEFLEKSWLFVKTAQITKLEKVESDALLLRLQGGNYYKMTTQCPHCGEEIQYIERLLDSKQPFWLGTGCKKCNKRVKIVS